MFLTLLFVNFIVSLAVCFLIVWIFRKPVSRIMQRLVAEEISSAWTRYITFAIIVVGLSGGVRVWDLEKYISPPQRGGEILQLTSDRWVLELYRTLFGTLQAAAWMLLVFFAFALIAYVIVRGQELRRQKG